MDISLNLKSAHKITDDFERKIKEEISSIKRITTHIETELDIESSIGHERTVDQSHLEKIKSIALSVEGVSECKDIGMVYVGKELHITLTIKLNLNHKSESKGKPNDVTGVNSDDDDVMSIGRTYRKNDKSTILVIPNELAKRLQIENSMVSMYLLDDYDDNKHLVVSKNYKEIVID
jgi:hypothetical protein